MTFSLGFRPFRSRIGRRLVLAIILFSSFITLVATSAQMYGDYRHDIDTIHDYLGMIRSSYLETLADSVWTYDDIAIGHHLDGLLRLPDMERLEITIDGKVRWAIGKTRSEHLVEESFPLVHRYRGKEVTLGHLRVQASLDQVYVRLLHTALTTLAVNGFKTFLVAGFALFLFQVLVTRHLVTLAGHLEKVDLNDPIPPFELDRPATKPGQPDELDRVTTAVNQLKEKLESTLDDLLRSEERFRTSFEEAVTGMTVVGLDSRFLKTNPAFQTLLGYSGPELEKLSFQAVTLPEDLDIGVEFVRRALAGELASVSIEKRYVTKDGDIVHAAVSSRLVRDARGTPVHFVNQIQNITEQNRLEEQLRQTHKMEAVGTLAGGIAHDFNNILGAILGYSELALLQVPEDSKLAQDLGEIVQAGNRARELVKQILTFSHRGDRTRKIVQTHLAVGEALRLLRQTIPTSIPIVSDIRKKDDTVLIDPTQLHQIVMNLCTNAYHAMRSGGGTLSVTLQPIEANPALTHRVSNLREGPHVKLTVADTGVGMTPETLARAFEPFFTTKSQGEGTGMGLSVVHGIVQNHGGAIDIETRLGEGTRIDVYLPHYSGETDTSTREEGGAPGGTERILVVDDEPTLAKMTRKILTSLGYEVESVTSSEKALATFLEDPSRFDLVITDQTMPGMTGAVLAEKMLAHRPDLSIVLCTGFSESLDEESALEIGAKAFLHKPLDRSALARTLRAVLAT